MDASRHARVASHTYRVTKVIGGHHREDFAGVEIGTRDSLTENILPVSYLLGSGKFRYKGLRQSLEAEIRFLKGLPAKPGTPVKRLLVDAIDATRERFGEAQLVEMGIGCESCHGGSRQHAMNPLLRTVLEPISPFLRLDRPQLDSGTLHSQQVIRACARCHQVLFSGYPWTWEGAKRNDSLPGGAHINSAEATRQAPRESRISLSCRRSTGQRIDQGCRTRIGESAPTCSLLRGQCFGGNLGFAIQLEPASGQGNHQEGSRGAAETYFPKTSIGSGI